MQDDLSSSIFVSLFEFLQYHSHCFIRACDCHRWFDEYFFVLHRYIIGNSLFCTYPQCFFIFQRLPGTFRVVSFLRTLGMFRGWYHFKERLECSGWYRTTLQNQRYILWISQVSVICEFLITKLAWTHEFIFQYF